MDEGVEGAVRLARISRELLRVPEEAATERSITRLAVETIDGCDCAALSIPSGTKIRTAAATSDVAEACAELQRRRREGPCVEVSHGAEMIHVEDVMSAPRWPAWGHRVSEMGVASVLAVRLSMGAKVMAALGMYAVDPEAFDASSIAMAQAFATVAAVALMVARQATGFTNAVHDRHVVGVAQGILATRHGLTVQGSFQLLRRYSNSRNTKLTDVARHVIETGDLPGMATVDEHQPDPQRATPLAMPSHLVVGAMPKPRGPSPLD